MKVDIILPQGRRGGVENLVNQLIEYSKENNKWEIRVIQFVGIGEKWLPDDVDYTVFNIGVTDGDASFFATQYSNYLMNKGFPDIILASVWPLMCVVARLSINIFNLPYDIPIVYWAHAPINVYEKGGYGKFSHIMLSDVQITISDYIYNEIASRFDNANILPVKNAAEIPDESQMVSTKIYKINEKEKHNLLFVGRLSEEKNLETIIDGLKNLPNWTLTIVGTGDDYEDMIKEMIKTNNMLDRVTFCGWHKNPWKYAKQGDYLIMSSLFEGFPLTIIEALARGIPVLSTPVSGTIEVVIPGKTGYLFEMMNPKSLEDILIAIESGKLPEINPFDCREVVKRYDGKLAFLDFCSKIEEIFLRAKSGIMEKFEKCYLYEDDKISVLLPVCDADETYIDKCLYNITHQTMPLNNMEIIVVNTAKNDSVKEVINRYENEYSENILLINVDENIYKSELLRVALQYSSGNFYFPIYDIHEIGLNVIDRLYRKIKLYGCDIAFCVSSKAEKMRSDMTGYIDEAFFDDVCLDKENIIYDRKFADNGEKILIEINEGNDIKKKFPIGTKYACIYDLNNNI